MAMDMWYQNKVGSLLNQRGVPIKVSLCIIGMKQFRLKVEHLHSPQGGSEGWFSFSGEMELCPQPGTEKASVYLRAEDAGEALKYDAQVLEAATAFAFGCLKRAGGAVLSALRLEMDLATNRVIVTPQAAVVRLLWWQPVVLEPMPCPQLQAVAA